jgi:hypothetical protein
MENIKICKHCTRSTTEPDRPIVRAPKDCAHEYVTVGIGTGITVRRYHINYGHPPYSDISATVIAIKPIAHGDGKVMFHTSKGVFYQGNFVGIALVGANDYSLQQSPEQTNVNNLKSNSNEND